MEIPNNLKGESNGAFFRRKDKSYTFIGYGKRSPEEGKKHCEELFDCTFIKQVNGINDYFFKIANLFIEERLSKKIDIRPEDLKIEEIIRYATRNEEDN